MILEWPKGFEQLANEVQAAASSRPGHYGVRKQFGVLHRLNRYTQLAEPFRAVIKKEIDSVIRRTAGTAVLRQLQRNRGDLITALEVDRRYGIPRKILSRLIGYPRIQVYRAAEAIKSPILFDEAEIAALAKQRRSIPRSCHIAKWLGVPLGTLTELEEAGLILREGGPVVHLVGADRCYRKTSVDELMASMRLRASNSLRPKHHVSLGKAMQEMLPGEKPWAQVFKSILSGDLRVYQNHVRGGSLTDQLSLASSDELAKVIACTSSSLNRANELITVAEAASIIGTSYFNVFELSKIGLIPRSAKRRLRRSDVSRFIAFYMLTPEIARRMGTNVVVANRALRAGRIQPLRKIGKLVWSRREVERFLKSRDTNRVE
jgi:hypothetical protein